jgi:pyrroline-5-carboxylate reductase
VSQFWIMGCGNMGGALLSRWLEVGKSAGLDPANVTVIDPAPRQIDNVRWLHAFPEGEAAPDRLMLGIKPQMLGALAPAIAPHVSDNTVILSILAGVEVATLTAHFPNACAIVRVMPNMPARLGKGATGLFLSGDKNVKAATDALFAPTGLVEWLDDEDLFHPLTAVSGSGPAFVYRFIDAMAAAGAKLGLPVDQALRLALATVEGASAVARASDAEPAELARRVASAGGTTARGLSVMDEGDAIVHLLQDTLTATDTRSREMAAEARQG